VTRTVRSSSGNPSQAGFTMPTFFERTNRALDQPLEAGPRVLLVGAAVLLICTYFFPLWNLTMFAPQYPDGLRLDIYSHTLQGGRQGQDIKEINVLNHYIGMHDIAVEDFTEFKWLPFGLGILALIFVRAAVHGKVSSLLDAAVLFGYFALFSLWSFAYKLYRYGHDLAPTASVKVPGFTPPVFGFRQIANFEVYSYPQAATYLMVAAALLLACAFVLAWRRPAAPVTAR
jgi:copper chaperone NosL